MTPANITARTLIATPSITVSSLSALIQTSLTDAGLNTPFDSYVDTGNTNLVYQIVNDANKVYGTVYLLISITPGSNSFQINYKLGWNYSSTTKLCATVSSVVQSSSISNSISIISYAISHGEIKGTILSQNGINTPIFFLRPFYKDTWWNEANYPWGFIFTGSTMVGMTGISGNPYYPNYPDFTFPDGTYLANANTYTLVRSIWPMGLILLSTSRAGIPGYFQDLRQAAIYQLSAFSRLDSPTESWFILSPGNGGLVLLSNPTTIIN